MLKTKKEKAAVKSEHDQKLKKTAKPVKVVKPASAKSKVEAVHKLKKAAPAVKHKTEALKKKKVVPHHAPAPVVELAKEKPSHAHIVHAPTVKPEVKVEQPKTTPVEPKKPHLHSVKALHPHEPKKEHAVNAPHPAKTQHAVVSKPAVEAESVVKPEPVVPEKKLRDIELELPINVKDLSIKLQEKPSVIIKLLMDMRVIAGINQFLDEKVVSTICEKFGCVIKKAPDQEEIALSEHIQKDPPELLKPRPPIVTFMGHVDHGKTSLLDAIRKTKVVESEHGGITQHIGAYKVTLPQGEITFLDTPGHEAFTAMRARGAKITDIVVLVVAADEGIMPQTQEAIDHARAAGVSIIVAINKIDRPQADVDRVKKALSELNLLPEDWGGQTITVGVSAKTGQGIDQLLELILLEAQMLELKANPNRPAKGVVIEAKMSKGKGPVATLLIQSGTLHLNQNIIVGKYYGKIRAMFDDHGRSVTKAGVCCPVEVLGISGVPDSGEQFFAITSDKEAKELALLRQEKEKQLQQKVVKRISLEDLHTQIQEGKLKELKLIIKADVHGSLEAIKEVISKINTDEIKLDIIHEGVGTINTSDVILAVASNALILGFNVGADDLAKELVAKEGVDVKTYNIIYELGNDIKAALEGMLEPKLKRVFLGKADVRKVFRLSRSGMVAGCFVTKGKITRSAIVNLVRNGEVVLADAKISALKRFKDDVREVAEGYECGITLVNFEGMAEGDVIEAYDIEKIVRKL